MTDIDHKALADAIRADLQAETVREIIDADARRFDRMPDLEAAYLQLADERQSLIDRVKELEMELEDERAGVM
jgi:hypothetical protein